MNSDELRSILSAHNASKTIFTTQSGHPITYKEKLFIQEFVKLGDATQAANAAGYGKGAGKRLLSRDYIQEELIYLVEELDKQTVADGREVMQYFTRVMRNQEKDQFGLDAPLSERTAAAKEIAKRTIDIEQAQDIEQPAININLNWKRDNEEITTEEETTVNND